VSPAYTRISGYSAEEVIGRRPGEFLHGRDTDPDTRARIRAALEREEPVREEILNYRKDGRPFWVELSIVPIRDRDGRLAHWASIQRETTERRQMEDRNARLYAEAREATRARDMVFRIVAHDLRNPLTRIGMAATLLGQGWLDDAESRNRQIEIIHRAVHQMDGLIQDLLDVARMQAGQAIPVEPDVVDPAGILAESVESHRALAEERRLRLVTEVLPELPAVRADRDRLLQVLQNVIGNAIKFTPPGGRITIGARCEASEVVFTVSDTGPGVPPEDLPHLFDAFWQAERAAAGGAGLGLAIAKGIIEAHNGSIWAENGRDQGATFHFSVPVAGWEHPG